MTKDEALDKALDKALYALEIEDAACRYMKDETPSQIVDAITAIKQARSAKVQEPVAVTYKEVADAMNALWGGTLEQVQIATELANKKLYTTPPAAQRRQWVGLTRAECLQIEKDMAKYYDYQHECKTVCLPEFARAIEAKLKEKNT